MTRVLHVITGLRAGGAENQLEMLVGGADREVEVCALYNADGDVGDRIRARGVPVHDLRMRSNKQLGKVRELARLMRRGRFDVAHLHLYRATVYGRVAARLAGVPVVVTTEHSLGETQIEGRPKGGVVRGMYLATEAFSDATVAVSPAVRDRLIGWGVPRRKILYVPNGLEFGRYASACSSAVRRSVREDLEIPEGAFVVGAVGRLHAGKKLDVLLSAAAPVLLEGDGRGGSGTYLLLAGDGPQREPLVELAADLGIERRVVFVGEVPADKVPGVLAALDLFVSLSREETFGLSILEAVAAKRRVLADACPALDALGGEGSLSGVRRLDRRPTTEEEAVQVRRTIEDARTGALRHASPTPEMLERYGAGDVARRLDGLYRELLGHADGDTKTTDARQASVVGSS